MSDQPSDTPATHPPSRADAVKTFIGDLARPFAIYAVASTTAASISYRDAAEIGAAGLILAALYGARSLENARQVQATADVEIARAQTTGAA